MVGVTARLSGVFPEYESGLFLPLIALLAMMNVSSLNSVGIMFISMVADLVDDHELKTGERQEGVFAAGVTFSTKAVGSLGVVIGGFCWSSLLASRLEVRGTEITEDVLFRLAITDAIIVNSLLVIPAYLISNTTSPEATSKSYKPHCKNNATQKMPSKLLISGQSRRRRQVGPQEPRSVGVPVAGKWTGRG